MELTRADLVQYIGTTNYYKHPSSGLEYTDGVQHMAQAGEAYWLIDAIASYHRQEPFQVWTLTVTGMKAVLTMVEDTGQPVLVRQDIPFTDFPLDEIVLWLIEGVLILPSEY